MHVRLYVITKPQLPSHILELVHAQSPLGIGEDFVYDTLVADMFGIMTMEERYLEYIDILDADTIDSMDNMWTSLRGYTEIHKHLQSRLYQTMEEIVDNESILGYHLAEIDHVECNVSRHDIHIRLTNIHSEG